MRRFGLDEARPGRCCARWIAAAGVRWGLDAETRRAAGAGDWAQNTWRFGLDRLLLGLAQARRRRRWSTASRPGAIWRAARTAARGPAVAAGRSPAPTGATRWTSRRRPRQPGRNG
ncbi:MAG: hypothetical protein U5K33_08380 [Halofilum sp. (in: g-proteobacteria)]|nr:hypothetical protein [Halofilum sp. (in: g-proteobacteria)]